MSTHHLDLDRPTSIDVAWAIQRAIDHLTAKAIIAQHDGHESAAANIAEYRSQIRRLEEVATAFEPSLVRPPSPETAAVQWSDRVYTISEGKPVEMIAERDVQHILQAGMAVLEGGLLTPDHARQLRESAVYRKVREDLREDPAEDSPKAPSREAEIGRELGRDLEPPTR